MPGSFVLIQEQEEALVHVQKTQQQQTGVADRSCPPSGIRRDASSSAPSWSDVVPCSSSLASSSHDSTEETENDEEEEDDELLLAGLAQHVAQTMLNGAAAAADDDSVLHSASGSDGKRTHYSLCTEANKVGNLFLFTLVFFACPEEASMLPFVSFETIFFRKKKPVV
jgi:hypothetical protein